MVGLLLHLLTLSLPSSTAFPTLQQVLMDASNCINIRCEWRGVGKQCKSAPTLQTYDYGQYYDFLNDNESDGDLLKRIKGAHPLNTFTIVNSVELDEMCKGRRL